MPIIDPNLIAMMDRYHDPQHNPENRDNRTIEEYNDVLKDCVDLSCTGIGEVPALLTMIHPEQEEIIWVDYCCGRGVALMKGTSQFNEERSRVVSSLGVDMRRFDGLPYVESPGFVRGQTRFYQHDLDQGSVSGLNPDFITCLKGLLYVQDPLFHFQAMYEQLREGGYMLITLSTFNTIDYNTPLGTEIVEYLRDRSDITLRCCASPISHSEFEILLGKPVGAPAKLDLGLVLESVERDYRRGWTYCNYTEKE